jgi:hypothetical protein
VSYSIYLCLFVYSIFLFVFLLVSCVPNVDSLIWIVHFLIAPSVFSNVYLQFLWIVHFLIAPSVFSNVYLQFLWIVHFLIAPSVFSNVYFLPPVIFGKAFDHLSFHQL